MADLTGVKIGSGTKVHAAHVIERKEIMRFGRVYRTDVVTGLPLCGASIWLKRGGYGHVSAIDAPITCERCMASVDAK